MSRAYDDRGWTLFESIIIDGKAASQRLQLFNWLTIDEKFGSQSRQNDRLSLGDHPIEYLARGTRTPPCTPERFKEMLDERQARANQKGVSLFTSGSDQPFVIDKFAAAFEEQILAERFIYAALGWTDRDMETLAEVLVRCRICNIICIEGAGIGIRGKLIMQI